MPTSTRWSRWGWVPLAPSWVSFPRGLCGSSFDGRKYPQNAIDNGNHTSTSRHTTFILYHVPRTHFHTAYHAVYHTRSNIYTLKLSVVHLETLMFITMPVTYIPPLPQELPAVHGRFLHCHHLALLLRSFC